MTEAEAAGGDDDAPVEALGLLRHDVLVELYRYPPGPAVALPPLRPLRPAVSQSSLAKWNDRTVSDSRW